MFAQSETGKTKASAITYDWSSGIYVSSEAGVGKWYKVPLLKEDGGPFNCNTCPKAGKTDDGKTDINITIKNPLHQEVDINCTAYIGDNETNRQFKMAADGTKSMTFGAGMFVRMGINEVYLYLVTDVTVTEEQAQEQHQAVNVDVQPVESNSVVFTPVDFDWTGFGTGTPAAGNEIAANKETWLKIDWYDNLTSGYTFKLYAKNLGSAATTVDGGLAMDCPATNIQEQSKDIAAGATISKVIDQAMLSMMPGTIYLRLKANQKLHVWAEQVAPVLPAEPLFNADTAIAVTKGITYNIASNSVVYKADSAQLFPNDYGENTRYYAVEVIITNNGTEDAVITGKVAKNVSGEVYSAVERTYTIKAGQKISKKLDNTLLSNMHNGDEAFALVLNGSGVSFLLKDTCLEENPCVPAQAHANAMVIPAAGNLVIKNQAANTTKWYEVDVTAAKSAQADIELRMTTANAETADLTVDIAAVCAIGEPTQSYTGSSASTTVLAASACREVKVASRNSCSAAANERAEPSGMSTSISHFQKFASNALGNSFERMPVTVMGIMPGNCVTRTRGSFGRSPESTTRENVRGPGLNASSSAPARRAIRPRDVASTTTFARIAWRPLRSAITMPHACPIPSFSTPHGTAPVR